MNKDSSHSISWLFQTSNWLVWMKKDSFEEGTMKDSQHKIVASVNSPPTLFSVENSIWNYSDNSFLPSFDTNS